MRNKKSFIKYLLIIPGVFFLAACHFQDNHTNESGRRDSILKSDMLRGITDSINQFPDSSGLYFERGGMLYGMKEFDMAGKDIQKAIELNPMKADYYIALGEILLTGDHYASAEKAFRKAIYLNPGNLMARLRLSYTLLNQKRYKETILETDTLLQLDNQIPEVYGLQSQAYSALKDTVQSLAIMEKAVKLAPNNYDVLMAVGDLLLNKKNAKALQYYEKAKNADTTQAEPLYCIGLFYEKTAKPDSAVNAYKACISRDAYYLDAYLHLGKIYEAENSWEKAFKIYTLATEIDPRSSIAFYERGACYEKLNQPENALNDYENAYSLDRKNVEAKAAMERMRKILSPHKT